MDGEGRTPLPWIFRALLAAVLPRVDRTSMMVEMEELYRSRSDRFGRWRARLWLIRAVAGFAVRLAGVHLAQYTRDAAGDVRHGVRVLANHRAYAVTAVLTLGLGVGGLTSVYAVADRVLLRPVPGVRDPARLVTLRLGSTESPRPSWPVSHPDLDALRSGVGAATSLGARTTMDVNLAFEEGGPPLRIRAAATTGGWFELLGVRLLAGRPPSSGADPASAGRGEVALAAELAASLAPRPGAALGRSVLVDGRPHRVVGVVEPGFRGAELPGEILAWLGPAALRDLVPGAPADLFRRGRRGIWDVIVARMAPGAVPGTVETQADRVMEAVRLSGRPNTFSVTHFEFQAFPGVGLDPGLRGPVRRTLGFLAGAAAFLLLLALLNVANLTLAHAASRRRARAVRRALGAGTGRLTRQLLAEHLVLGVGGALVGMATARLGLQLFRGVRLEEYGAGVTDLHVGWKVLTVGVGLAVAAALASGLAVAAGSASERLLGGLHGAGSGSRPARRAGSVLAAAQVALSVVLLVGAGLMARTVVNLRALDLGFRPDGLLAFTVDPASAGTGPAEVRSLLDGIVAELEGDPAVAAAGFAYPEPLSTSYLTSWLAPAEGTEDDGVIGAHLQVRGHFLRAMGVGLVAGRTFEEGEGAGPTPRGESVALLTRAGAEAIFRGRSPDRIVGTRAVRPRPDQPPLRIVGVIDDLRLTGPREDPPPVFVVPWDQGFDGTAAVGWVRARSGRATDLAGTVRSAVRRVAPSLPVYDVRTVREQADRMAAGERVLAALVSAVSVLGLILAAVGLHGVLAHTVTRRRREIGIRAALGARPGEVLGRVLGGGLGISSVGLVAGLVGAFFLTRLLRGRLYGVEPLDPPTYVLGSVLLLVVAALASWAPARRATRVPPAEVLRRED